MSTLQRYGTIVWDGYIAASKACEGTGDVYVTIGEISRKSGVSRPTVSKYMKMLIESKDVKGFFTAGMWFFEVAK